MPAPACCLLVALFASSAVVEAAAGAEGEVAAGRAPIELDGPEENSVTFTLVPGAALRVRSVASSLTLTYTPRIFYRVPNALEVDRPLVLHQLALDHSQSFSRRLTWATTGNFSIGEIDYTASNLVFDPGTSAVRSSVTDIVRADATTGIKLDVTRRLRWTLDVSGEYTKPLGDDDLPDNLPANLAVLAGSVPESAQFSTKSSLSYAINRTDRLAANGEVTYQWFPDRGRFLLLSPDISWESQLNRRTNISLSAGVAYVISLETQVGVSSENAFGGTGGFSLSTVMYKTRQATATTTFNATVDWFFDPVAGTSQPRAGVDLGTDITIGRDWVIGPSASFYTTLRDPNSTLAAQPVTDPADPTTQTLVINDYSTTLRGELPFRYNLNKYVGLNWGVRASLRGRSIVQDDFKLGEQYEIWGFFGLSVRYAGGHDTGNWLSL